MRSRPDKIQNHRCGIRILVTVTLIMHLLGGSARAESSVVRLEKQVLKKIAAEDFNRQQVDRRCHAPNRYRVYLIDNFEQDFNLIPEVMTSHGELLPPKT